jgi:hypothetical protein
MRKVLGGRRLLAAIVATLTVAGPVALTARTSAANPLNVADLGVTLQVAQATQHPLLGGTTIEWQSTATVNPGEGTLLRASIANDGTLPQSDATLTVDTGGTVDPDYDLDPACSATSSVTVTCSFGSLAAGQSSPTVHIAVETGAATSLIHTATVAAFPGETLQLPLAQESPDSASATTTVADSGYAFLTDGESAEFASADGAVKTTFTVQPGTTNGGGAFVHLYEGNGSDSICGTTFCQAAEARADFVQVGGTPATVETPFIVAVEYPKQNCAGRGGGSSCNPIYHQKTGTTFGLATNTANCSGENFYHPNGEVAHPHAIPDPCVYGRPKGDSGEVRFLIAVLEDIGFPIPQLL